MHLSFRHATIRVYTILLGCYSFLRHFVRTPLFNLLGVLIGRSSIRTGRVILMARASLFRAVPDAPANIILLRGLFVRFRVISYSLCIIFLGSYLFCDILIGCPHSVCGDPFGWRAPLCSALSQRPLPPLCASTSCSPFYHFCVVLIGSPDSTC